MKTVIKNFLAIESSFSIGCVALYHQGKISEKIGDKSLKNSDYLLQLINQLFNENNFLNPQIHQLDAIALSYGPGNFTSLRVGASIAKALAYSFKIPIIAINSLETIAISALKKQNFKPSEEQKIMLHCAMDARMKSFYCADFEPKWDKNNFQLVQKEKTKLIDIVDFENYLKNKQCKKNNHIHYLIGNAYSVYYDYFSKAYRQYLSDKFKIIEIENASSTALVDAVLNSNNAHHYQAIDFDLNYVRNKVADKPKMN